MNEHDLRHAIIRLESENSHFGHENDSFPLKKHDFLVVSVSVEVIDCASKLFHE